MKNKQLQKRFETAEKMGLLNETVFALLSRQTDALMRLQGGQFHYWVEFLETEKFRTGNFGDDRTLANDKEGYQCIQLLAILTHPCQLCAEDVEAWHTRRAFCPHKK